MPGLFAVRWHPAQGVCMGYVVWQGASRITGKPIVVIATGTERPSKNPKTGPMVQCWILDAQVDPSEARRTGADANVCGGCSLRGTLGKAVKCYVQVHHAPLTVWRTWQAGGYAAATLEELSTIGRGRHIRLGAYGDPAAVPLAVWDALLQDAAGWTGYTHQWRSARLRDVTKYCMASCDSEADLCKALSLGLSTFRVLAPGDGPLTLESACPAEHGVQCRDCQRCQGTAQRQHITIAAHGRGARHFDKNPATSIDFHVQSADFTHTTTQGVGYTYERRTLPVV